MVLAPALSRDSFVARRRRKQLSFAQSARTHERRLRTTSDSRSPARAPSAGDFRGSPRDGRLRVAGVLSVQAKSMEATLGTGDGHFSGSRTGHVEARQTPHRKASHELRLHRVAARRDACSRRCRLRSRWACLALNGPSRAAPLALRVIKIRATRAGFQSGSAAGWLSPLWCAIGTRDALGVAWGSDRPSGRS